MVSSDRLEAEKVEREKFYERWNKATDDTLEYGNFCIKMLITLNSTAILACFAFIGSYSNNKSPVIEAMKIAEVMPRSFVLWASSFTLILLTALSTYICNLFWPSMLGLQHKVLFSDLHGDLSKSEKTKTRLYNSGVILGIFFGALSLVLFLIGVWNIALVIFHLEGSYVALDPHKT